MHRLILTILVLWAQRSSAKVAAQNIIYLTVRLIDPEDLKINLEANSLDLTAKSNDKDYKLHIDFYGEIDEKESHYHVAGSHIAFVIRKKELKAEYWPRLTKEKGHYHYIRTDFEKWVDEDEQQPVEDPAKSSFDPSKLDLAALAKQYGGKGAPSAGGSGPSQFGDFKK